MRNLCLACDGFGTVHDPSAAAWRFWRKVECSACGGDGIAKPPGWPDQKEISRLRPPLPGPPPPPPAEVYYKGSLPRQRKMCVHDAMHVIAQLSEHDKLAILNDLNKQFGIASLLQRYHEDGRFGVEIKKLNPKPGDILIVSPCVDNDGNRPFLRDCQNKQIEMAIRRSGVPECIPILVADGSVDIALADVTSIKQQDDKRHDARPYR